MNGTSACSNIRPSSLRSVSSAAERSAEAAAERSAEAAAERSGDVAASLDSRRNISAMATSAPVMPKIAPDAPAEGTARSWSELTGRATDALDYYLVFAGLRFTVIMVRMGKLLVDMGLLPPTFPYDNHISRGLAQQLARVSPRPASSDAFIDAVSAVAASEPDGHGFGS